MDCLRTSGRPNFCSTPPGLELKNSLAAFGERDSDDEIPLVSVDDFPAVSTEQVFEKKSVPRVGKFKTETQKTACETRSEWCARALSTYPWEERDDQPRLHAVSVSRSVDEHMPVDRGSLR